MLPQEFSTDHVSARRPEEMTEISATDSTRRLCWRRLDRVGLELLELRTESGRTQAHSSVICAWNGGFRLDHAWEFLRIDPDGFVRSYEHLFERVEPPK
jgi:hypothetical protein